jgi:hypothetical protein
MTLDQYDAVSVPRDFLVGRGPVRQACSFPIREGTSVMHIAERNGVSGTADHYQSQRRVAGARTNVQSFHAYRGSFPQQGRGY